MDISNIKKAFIIHEKKVLAYNNNEKLVTIPEGVEGIGENAFKDNLTINRIKFPSTLKYIEKNAFCNAKNLKTVVFNKSNEFKIIGESAFKGCESLVDINIIDVTQEVKTMAFMDCISLLKINIPKNLNVIEDKTFENCKKLISLAIPNNVTEIGVLSFAGCTSLKNLILGKGVDKICGNSFLNCTSLISIKIPKNILII